jgi:hypothetical protein
MTATSLGSPPPHTHHASSVHEPPAAIRATGIIVALIGVLAILAIAFALPAARSKPHDVPIGAAGPQAAGTGPGFPAGGRGVADILEQHAPGTFTITYYPGEAALRDAIRTGPSTAASRSALVLMSPAKRLRKAARYSLPPAAAR